MYTSLSISDFCQAFLRRTRRPCLRNRPFPALFLKTITKIKENRTLGGILEELTRIRNKDHICWAKSELKKPRLSYWYFLTFPLWIYLPVFHRNRNVLKKKRAGLPLSIKSHEKRSIAEYQFLTLFHTCSPMNPSLPFLLPHSI